MGKYVYIYIDKYIYIYIHIYIYMCIVHNLFQWVDFQRLGAVNPALAAGQSLHRSH